MGTTPGQRKHPVAPDVGELIANEQIVADPTALVKLLVQEKDTLQAQVQHLTRQITETQQELKEAKAVAEELEPYQHILKDTRTYLPVYLRDRVVFNTLLIKLERLFPNRETDIFQKSEAGRKAAHRKVDSAVEKIIEGAMLEWHKFIPRIKGGR